jgi:preprotein translocase subunit SecG
MLLTTVILIICFILGAVILIQNPKGGGLAAGFTGGAQMGGVQRTTDFLEKTTWYLVVALFVSCLYAGIMNGDSSLDTGVDDSLLNSGTQTEFAEPTGESLGDPAGEPAGDPAGEPAGEPAGDPVVEGEN